jgi:thiamine pyrophosphate-dependent acetolactate synthase large subunit-like protein
MLRRLEIPYIAVEPGASFRGLHDSIVNYLGNEGPELIICNHEEVAVAVAHGYAKYTGRAMAAAVHSTVGLMHATMTIFCAWCDRAPVFILGGTGPMDATARRPWIDWIHTASAQGELVRDFTKWEHQPASVAAIPEAMLRGWQAANLEPRGPVYVCLDAGLQEQRLGAPVALPDVASFPPPSPPSPDPAAVARAAALLVAAEHPVLLLGHTGGTASGWAATIALAESLGLAVVTDRSSQAAFPTDHPLHQGMWRTQTADGAIEAIRDADVILAVQRTDVAGALREREGRPVHLINVTLEPYAVRSWSADYQELPAAGVPITASAEPSIVAIGAAVADALGRDPAARARVAARATALGTRSRSRRATLQAEAASQASARPMRIARAIAELRAALGPRAADAVVAQAPHAPWPTAAWDFSTAKSYLGHDGGAAVGSGPGIAVGAALAARGSGRPVIAVIGDGELLAAPTALWTAAHHGIPVLFVIANNQSYHNDENHQDRVARTRGRPPENRWIGQRMDRPAIDFAALARDLGAVGIGPVDDPAELGAAFRAALVALDEGKPVLVDVRVAD